MDVFLNTYWWVIFLIFMALLGLIFSFEKKKDQQGKHVSQNYIDGLKAMIEGDEHGAFVKLKQTVNEDSENIDAYIRIGELMRKKGQHQKAVQIHRQLLLRKNLDSNVIALIWKCLASDFISAKKFNMADEILQKIAKEPAFKKWAKEKMLEVFEKSNQWEKAFEIGKEIYGDKEQQERLAVYKYLAGAELFKSGEFHKARLTLKESLHYDDKFAPSYILIAESYLAENRKEEAAEYFKKLCLEVPREAYQVFYKMEQTMFELGQFPEVESIYRKMLQQCPNDPDILRSLAVIAEKKGDINGAIDALQQVVNAFPDDMAAAGRLAGLYLENGQKQKATRLLQNIYEQSPLKKHYYACPYCRSETTKIEMVCPSCGKVGPYKRV